MYKGFGNAITFYESQFASYSAKLVLLFAMTLYFLARRFSRLRVDDEVDGEIVCKVRLLKEPNTDGGY